MKILEKKKCPMVTDNVVYQKKIKNLANTPPKEKKKPKSTIPSEGHSI